MRAPTFVVADGMGGAQAGEVASEDRDRDVRAGARRGRGARRSGSRPACARPTGASMSAPAPSTGREGMGTTLTAAYVGEDELAIAHVGDSRAYLFRDGELKRLKRDHSLVDELVRGGKLTEEQAAEHPQRSIITRALGPEPDVEVDTWSYPVRPGDVLLLCSDGLTSMISEAEITTILSSAAALDGGRRAPGRRGECSRGSRQHHGGPVPAGRTRPRPRTDETSRRSSPRPPADHRGAGRARDRRCAAGRASHGLPCRRRRRAPPRRRCGRTAPGQAPAPPGPAPRKRRYRKALAALIAVAIVLFLVGGAAISPPASCTSSGPTRTAS